MSNSDTRNIVIIGGGIIGCTSAYYLTHRPEFISSNASVIVLEASLKGIAQGASGKAGGLVAKWAYPKEIVNISFPEHVRLAEKHNGKDRWGWRFVGCGRWEGQGESLKNHGDVDSTKPRKSLEKTVGLGEGWRETQGDKGLPQDLDWVKEDLTNVYSPMAPYGHNAQVHPYLFTISMLELATERGAKLVSGKATSINIDQATRTVTGVTYIGLATGKEETIPATHVVLAAGAWSPRLLPTLPISGTRAHSITVKPDHSTIISPYVLFTEIALPLEFSLRVADPEIYARPSNEVYCCGPGDDSPLPDTVDDVEVDQDSCESIWQHVSSISTQLRSGTVDKRQACFLPSVSVGGGPIIGEATSVAKGLVIATGHTCWGISNAPGTAKAISELIFEGKIKCANLKNLVPSRFL